MPINFRGYLNFLFNSGRGVRTNQLDGDFVERAIIVGEQLTLVQSTGGPNPQDVVLDLPPQRLPSFTRVGVKDSKTFTAADFGSVSRQELRPVPTFTGADKHLAIWWTASSPSIDTVRLYTVLGSLLGSDYNYISQFGKPIPLTIGSTDGYYIVSDDPIKESRSGIGVVVYSKSSMMTFVRRLTYRTATEGNTFVAADFTGARAATSTNEFIQMGGATPTENIYFGLAVPADETPVSDILTRGFGGFLSVFVQWDQQAGVTSIGGVDHTVWAGTQQYYAGAWDTEYKVEQVPKL